MDGPVRLQRSYPIMLQRCMLGLTLLLLLFEVIVSRLCNCLINMVDSFHTLYLLFPLALQHLCVTQGPLTSSSSSSSSISPPNPEVPPATSHNSICPILSTTSQGPAATTTSNHDTPEILPADSNSIVNSNTTISDHPNNTSPSSSSSPSPSSSFYKVTRLQPFGALVSALLVASLCVSVSLEILNHVLQPHPIQRPVLATAASALSLLFNVVVLGLTWSCQGRWPLGAPAAAAAIGISSSTAMGMESGTGSPHWEIALKVDARKDGDGSLVFSNPAATSEPDLKSVSSKVMADRGSQERGRDGLLPCTVPKATEGPLNNLPNCQSRDLELEDRPSVYTAHPGYTGNAAAQYSRHLSTPIRAPSTIQQSSLWAKTTILRDLLCPCLALANALTALLGTPDCHHPQEACSSLVYLDPALSTGAVLVILAFALPEVHHLGLLLLQSCPPGLSVPELKRSLVSVHGVVGVHELHVWQLDESCWVASVHVHVNGQHCLDGANEVVDGVTKKLLCAGVSVCTVQPEMLTEGGSGEMALSAESGDLGDLPCSLVCGKACEKKLCCSPLTQEDTRTTSSGAEAPDIMMMNVIDQVSSS